MKNTKIKIGIVILIGIVSISFQDRFFEIAKQIQIYNNLYKTLNINYIDELNQGDLTAKAINNTLENLDPYTRFYNEQQVEDAKIRREGEYGGIGISSKYTTKGIVIVAIKEGFPADKVGLKPGDVITVVNNQSLEELERAQLSQVLKGTPETPISLRIERGNEQLAFNLKLDKIIDNPVPFYDMINENTGYVVLTQFTARKSTDEVRNAIQQLKSKGMEKLVFDLRSNPGGSLFDAVNITNLFIPSGKKVVDTRGKTRKNSRTYSTSQTPLDTEMPVVVLINRRSASASEIVSGALQDYDRAVIMGQRSFGKGLVQRYFNLSYGTQMKATISKYYTPSGRCIQELDYANRDLKTGKVPKFSDKIINSFTTSNGRVVKDGGGVTPDIVIDLGERTEATKKLLNSSAIFNFATNYVRSNPKPSLESFVFDASHFSNFTNYLKTKDTTFVSEQEKLFRKAFTSVENNEAIATQYKQLIKELEHQKIHSISKNKKIVLNRLRDEILEQYFYKKGVYQYRLKNDETIQKAVNLLNNTKEYQRILSNGK
jgi:carboxyl-terminal processing protease